MMAFLQMYGERILSAVQVHLAYVLVSVGVGLVVALVLGIILSRVPQYAQIFLPILSVFQTIPGIVFIGLLFLVLGMVPVTVITALSIYAVFPILKNTYTGLLDVDPALIEAAKGCGMSSTETLFEVEIPMALPSIFAGFKMSTIYTVSWAVLAAMIGLGGLGEFIYIGIYSNNDQLILAGAIPAAIIAIILSLAIDALSRVMISEGVRSVK